MRTKVREKEILAPHEQIWRQHNRPAAEEHDDHLTPRGDDALEEAAILVGEHAVALDAVAFARASPPRPWR